MVKKVKLKRTKNSKFVPTKTRAPRVARHIKYKSKKKSGDQGFSQWMTENKTATLREVGQQGGAILVYKPAEPQRLIGVSIKGGVTPSPGSFSADITEIQTFYSWALVKVEDDLTPQELLARLKPPETGHTDPPHTLFQEAIEIYEPQSHIISSGTGVVAWRDSGIHLDDVISIQRSKLSLYPGDGLYLLIKAAVPEAQVAFTKDGVPFTAQQIATLQAYVNANSKIQASFRIKYTVAS